MANFLNARDIALQATIPRTLPVTLPSTYNTSGDHTGTLTGSGQTNFQNGQITFSSTGTLNNAGGGSLTSLNNVGGNFTGNWNSLIQSLHQNNQISLSSTGALNNAGGGFLSSLNNVGGNYLGNWEGAGRTVHRNDQITMGSTGTLNGAGGGSISNLDYGNVGGSKPPASATENFFTRSSGNPSGGSTGDAHWNTSTSTMWFNTNGIWAPGGTVNANQITVGTLAAARIAANSVTTDKLNVGGALSNITPNLGNVTSGSINTSGTLNAAGAQAAAGSTYSAVFNQAQNAARGIYAVGGAHGAAGSNEGVLGTANSGGGVGGSFIGAGGAGALEAFGSILLQGIITIQPQTISGLGVSGSNVSGAVANANNATFATSAGTASLAASAANADSAAFADFASSASSATNASFATTAGNANAMGGVDDSGWCRGFATDTNQVFASGFGFGLTATVATVEVAGSGNNMTIRTISDRRKKTEITPETLGLDFILSLQPKTFRMKAKPETLQHGFIAQDIEAIIGVGQDSLAHTHPDGVKGSDIATIVSPLVNAVQEMNKKIIELQSDISKLKEA